MDKDFYDMTEQDFVDRSFEDSSLRASNAGHLTSRLLIETETAEGLLGVYNLGMKHMFEYLEKQNGMQKL